MNAFLTGGTGFIGQALIRLLLARGVAVTALVRTFERAQQLPRGVRAIPGDITKPEAFRHALAGADLVFHLAGVVKIGVAPKDRPRVQRINVEGARHVLELAVAAGASKIVYVSTVNVYGDTHGQPVDEAHRPPADLVFETEYQRTKHQAHYEIARPLQEQGAPVVIAMPGAVYGPGDLSPLQGVLRRQAQGRLWAMVGPENARCWAHVEDVAAGLWLAAERGRPGEAYHLAGPAHTFREFFTAVGQATGAKGPYLWVPGAAARLAARALHRPLPALAERLRAVSGGTYLASSAKAEAELGWQARPLSAGLRTMLTER